jgi:hypothetical protein
MKSAHGLPGDKESANGILIDAEHQKAARSTNGFVFVVDAKIRYLRRLTRSLDIALQSAIMQRKRPERGLCVTRSVQVNR